MKKYNLLSKYLLFFALAILGLSSCKKDDDDDDTQPESSTAVVATLRVNTPGGRVYYMGAYSALPTKVDYKSMVELGPSVTVYSYGEHPYAWSGAASTLTKYDVSNNLEISVADVLSFASTGLSGNFGPPAFLSETQAYFFVLAEGKIIEFNPTTMEITATINVTALAGSSDAEINTSTYTPYVTADGKIILPVAANPGTPDKFPQYAQIAVFDPASKAVTYPKDTRMSMGYDTFAKDELGNFYYRPSKHIARAKDYSSVTGNPTTGGLLKVNNDGSFDPTFFVDIKEKLDAHAVNAVVFVYGSKAVVQYIAKPYTVPVDEDEWYKATTQFALLDLNTGAFEEFTAFSDLGTVYTVGQVYGVEYYGNFGAKDEKYSILKQTGATNFEVAAEAVGGSCIFVGSLR